MKIIFLALFFTITSNLIYAQQKYKNIQKSTNIEEIEEYIKTTYPGDPKVPILKSRIIHLKNEAWTKGAKDAKPMAARPIVTEEVNALKANSNETEEFLKLLTISDSKHKEKTASLLTEIFSTDSNSTEAIFICKNNSDCNIILRIKGLDTSYDLAVPSHKDDFIIVKKGTYTITSNVCNVAYNTTKKLEKAVSITLNNATEKK